MESNKTQIKTVDLSGLLVIFGGTGDLTNRKLMPAIYNLIRDGLLPKNFCVLAVGRKQKTQEEYLLEMKESIIKYSRNEIHEEIWDKFQKVTCYYRMDFTQTDQYTKLREHIEFLEQQNKTKGSRIFYLAVAPEYFEMIIHGIQVSNLMNQSADYNRVVIEKPFGKDLKTARSLNKKILSVFSEKNIYRIDHYLGKEMIQNILVLRFCNFLFESVWNNKYIDNIQITLAETLGVEARGGYYENSGAMRDMVQNHILQILSLVAMEPPVNLKMDSIRNEKQKVLEAMEEITDDFLEKNVIFGQYGEGEVNGEKVAGYRQEKNVDPESETETFVALKVHINNFRWAGTPFYIRTGKRLQKSCGKIVIQFKYMPDVLYYKEESEQTPNLLIIKFQPGVGVKFCFNTKDFQVHNGIVTSQMDTSAAIIGQGNTPEAYERLLYDIIRGDGTLFSRWDEVEAAWHVADRLIQYREQKKSSFPNYEAGSMGPKRAEGLLSEDNRTWWDL